MALNNDVHFNKWWACVYKYQYAMALQHLAYSYEIHKHKMSDDGKEWMFFSNNRWVQKIFPFAAKSTVDGWLSKLEEYGLIESKVCEREGRNDNQTYTHYRLTEIFYHVEKEIEWFIIQHQDDKKYQDENGNFGRADLLGSDLKKHILKAVKKHQNGGDVTFSYIQNLGDRKPATPSRKSATPYPKTDHPLPDSRPHIRYIDKDISKRNNNNYYNTAAEEDVFPHPPKYEKDVIQTDYNSIIQLWVGYAKEATAFESKIHPDIKEQGLMDKLWKVIEANDQLSPEERANPLLVFDKAFSNAAKDEWWGQGKHGKQYKTTLTNILEHFWTLYSNECDRKLDQPKDYGQIYKWHSEQQESEEERKRKEEFLRLRQQEKQEDKDDDDNPE